MFKVPDLETEVAEALLATFDHPHRKKASEDGETVTVIFDDEDVFWDFKNILFEYRRNAGQVPDNFIS